MGKRYSYPTGNVELAIRAQNGESLFEVCQEIKEQWTPGNECLWDPYDAESLVDSDDKRAMAVNCLLYSRVTIFRSLREKGVDVQGKDPFNYLAEVPEEVERLKARFPELFTSASHGAPPTPAHAVDDTSKVFQVQLAPNKQTSASNDHDSRRSYLMLELPSQCPTCSHPFNMRFYPRRILKTTYLYFAICMVVAMVVASFLPSGLNTVALIAIVVLLGGIGMTFPKVVHLRCRSCGWSKKYLVRNAR